MTLSFTARKRIRKKLRPYAEVVPMPNLIEVQRKVLRKPFADGHTGSRTEQFWTSGSS